MERRSERIKGSRRDRRHHRLCHSEITIVVRHDEDGACLIQVPFRAAAPGPEPLVERVVGEFWDDGVTGKLPLWERPAGRLLLEEVQAGRVQAVAVKYADRFVIPYHPARIFLYAGDNDLNAGKTPEKVFGDFVAFEKKRVRPMTVSDETLLPEPDSPTMPSARPLSTV